MLNQNTKKSPKKLWKTPSPTKPSLSGPNLQFADLEANTLEDLSIEDLSSVSGGDGGLDPKTWPDFNSLLLQGSDLPAQALSPGSVEELMVNLANNPGEAEVSGYSKPTEPMFIIGCLIVNNDCWCNCTGSLVSSIKN